MAHHLTDLDRRLAAARPSTADATAYTCDDALLSRLRLQPVDRRRAMPVKVATPVAAGAVLAATGALLLGGGPGNVGAPDADAAVRQALHWLTPGAGTILHTRSIETSHGRQTIRDFWQSGDDPAKQRQRVDGDHSYEQSGNEFYDPATNTIYESSTPPVFAGPPPTKSGADPIVTKVRFLLAAGNMSVGDVEHHNGIEAFPVTLKEGLGRSPWTLWVSAADGKPLELRDGDQEIHWTTYDVSSGDESAPVLSLKESHPAAQIVTDPTAVEHAEARLLGVKQESIPGAKP